MKYSLTIFTSIFDIKTHRRMDFNSWDAFEDLLYKLSKEPGYKPKKGERVKNASPLITPAIFKEGTTRKNENVLEWASWVCMDVDNYDTSFEDAVAVFKSNRFVCYSTSSSTRGKPKFRVVLPLLSSVPADKIRHLWYALNKEFKSLGDPQTKDLSRMYYIPAQYPDSYQFIFSHKDASMIDPNKLMEKHPFISMSSNSFADSLSPEMRERITAYRKEKLTNTSYSWKSYSDCPFVNRTLITEYRCISETGWYSKMYQIMMSIASSAMRRGYPISSREIAVLCSEIDADTGGWYKNRPLETEASRALDFACRSL